MHLYCSSMHLHEKRRKSFIFIMNKQELCENPPVSDRNIAFSLSFCYNKQYFITRIARDFMDSFHIQLAAARKAKHLTQEQLAELMSVSRPTVSRWENGHILPDIETVKRLIAILEYDFITGQFLSQTAQPDAPAPENTAEKESLPQESPAEASLSPVKKRRMPLILAAVLGACLLAALVILLLIKNQPTTAYTLEWFRQEQHNDNPNQAFLEITPTDNPVKAVRRDLFGNGFGWYFEFDIVSKNDVALHIDSYDMTIFRSDGSSRTDRVEAVEFKNIFHGLDTVLPGGVYCHQGGFPLQDIEYLGIVITGTDETGAKLSFHGLVELSQEIAN